MGDIGSLAHSSSLEKTREELAELVRIVGIAEEQPGGFIGSFTGAVLIVNQALKLVRTYRRELRSPRGR